MSVTPELAALLAQQQQNANMVGQDPFGGAALPGTGSSLLDFLARLHFSGQTQLAQDIATTNGIPQQTYTQAIQGINDRTASDPHGVWGHISRLGNYSAEHPAILMAPAAIAGAIGALGGAAAGGAGGVGGTAASGWTALPSVSGTIPAATSATAAATAPAAVAGGLHGGLLGTLTGSSLADPALAMGVSAMSGKGGSGGSGDAGAQQAQLAAMLAAQTNPLRQSLIDRSGAFLNGGMDVTQSPVFGAFKNQTETQFQNARNNVIGDTAAGGQLTSALTNLNAQRASALGQGAGQVADTELARAMTLATGQTGQALSGLGQAANTQAMVAQSEADREAGMMGALATGAGAYFGSKA